MNKIKIFLYVMLLSVLAFSCKDDSLNPIVPWESAVHGYAKFTATSPTNFALGDKSKTLDLNFQWVSIDGTNTVNKIEFFVAFNENYNDVENNVRTANHDTLLLRTIEGSAVPGNRTNVNFKITQDELYNLYKDITFDYGNGPENVLGRTPRTLNAPFTTRDRFVLTWALTTTDGRYFDSWSNSTCTEFETYRGTRTNDGGFNCVVNWTVR
ncbi:MAG: hypothetical protein ACK4TA_01600 [Saprospiraceae bacterium]